MENYNQIQLKINRLRKLCKYEEILDLLAQAQEQLSEEERLEHHYDLLFGQAYYSALIQDYEGCFQHTRDLIEQGYSFPLFWERFQQLAEFPGYDQLVERNEGLILMEQRNARFEYQIHLPEGYSNKKQYPLFFALHGDGKGIEKLSSYWDVEPFLRRNFILVYLQSSQVLFHNNYGWFKNLAIAREEIRNCYQTIKEEYFIDQQQVLIGGFSSGALAALEVMLQNVIPVKGVITLCPIVKVKSFTKENVQRAMERGVKGVIMEGEQVLPVTAEEEMIKIFDEVGFPYRYVINPEVGHEAPKNFPQKLAEAIEFILA